MKVHGIGRANGGFSLLHAAGCGNGSAVPINLGTTVMLTDNPIPILADDANLLGTLLEAWQARDLPLPPGELGWEIKSEIPIGIGLKSSSALLVAAQRALSNATRHHLSAAVTYSLLSAVQIQCGVSMTSAIDDLDVAADWETVWLVDATDTTEPFREAIEFPLKEVYIIIRDKRKAQTCVANFQTFQHRFEDVVRLLRRGDPIEAFRLNGHLVAQALGDEEAQALCEEIEVRTGCPASISGSGPAIVVLADKDRTEIVEAFLNSMDLHWLRTKITTDEKFEVVREPWE